MRTSLERFAIIFLDLRHGSKNCQSQGVRYASMEAIVPPAIMQLIHVRRPDTSGRHSAAVRSIAVPKQPQPVLSVVESATPFDVRFGQTRALPCLAMLCHESLVD